MSDRRTDARDRRVRAAEVEFARPVPPHAGNGEETDYPFLANYSKGLPHNKLGEVDPAAYRLLLRALSTGRAADFERIPLGGQKLVNPQAGSASISRGRTRRHWRSRPLRASTARAIRPRWSSCTGWR